MGMSWMESSNVKVGRRSVRVKVIGFSEAFFEVASISNKKIMGKDLLSPLTGDHGSIGRSEPFTEMGLFPASISKAEEAKVGSGITG